LKEIQTHAQLELIPGLLTTGIGVTVDGPGISCSSARV
jgi:hypothetical protein